DNLKVVLIEEDQNCYAHLKNVIRRRWPNIPIDEAEGPVASNSSNVFLLNNTLDEALEVLEDLDLGNSLYYFDPLRSVEYDTIEKVADRRIKSFFKTGTEFFIFVFTSDWFLGRENFAPLPCTPKEESWDDEEEITVMEADSMFGNQEWRTRILKDDSIEERSRTLVRLYRNGLRKWFRYVLPLPFNPKKNEIFHLILCSNYQVGVRATRDFYTTETKNPRYRPNNTKAFQRFQKMHPETSERLVDGRRRPLEWLVLWRIIREHEDGISDCMCSDLRRYTHSIGRLHQILEWLQGKSYLQPSSVSNAWNESIQQYKLNWKVVRENLGVDPPLPLVPLSPEDMQNE
ncbi:hypothetical protein GTO27_13485, partial [Candidatus Bathyarchaeota archaeon]|nr:hypothetical protein [Candidatus Bathyarchaeota archaeon]